MTSYFALGQNLCNMQNYSIIGMTEKGHYWLLSPWQIGILIIPQWGFGQAKESEGMMPYALTCLFALESRRHVFW